MPIPRTLLLLLALSAVTTAAEAQQRVFVSAAHGDDTNPCTAPAPCRSFATALTAVLPGGEILVLDSGGYGRMMITNSVSVVSPPGVEGSITATSAGQDAIDIAAPGATVFLRGLSVFGLGVADNGVFVVSVGSLSVESCNFTGFIFAGLEFKPTSGGTLSVNNSGFFQNLVTGLHTTSSSGLANFVVTHSRLEGNARGLFVSQGSAGTVRDSSLSQNTINGMVAQTVAAGQLARVNVSRCVVHGNNDGIIATGNGDTGVETVLVSDSDVAFNSGTGILAFDANAHIASRSNNTVEGNATNGVFTDLFSAK